MQLSGYINSILNACLIFPFVAAVFTVPFIIRHYWKFGGIPMLRVIIVYSFILYSMCAYLLTVLPLPTIAEVAKMPDHRIQWIPFYDLYKAFQSAGFSLSNLSTFVDFALWKKLLKSSGLFQIVANIVMQIPLGVYLRYYFRRTWKQTLVIGLCVSLFYELTQLSGLYFIYPKAYRYCEIDDLINNTLGAMIGYWIAPLLVKLLPSSDRLDELSYAKGERVTLMRRLYALLMDWGILFVTWVAMLIIFDMDGHTWLGVWILPLSFGLLVILYFVILQWALGGRTPGKLLLRLVVVAMDDDKSAAPETLVKPKLKQLFIRYALLYSLAIPLLFVLTALVASFALTLGKQGQIIFIWVIVGVVVTTGLALFLMIRSYRKWGCLPHRHYSRTVVAQLPRKPRKRQHTTTKEA